MSALIDLAVRVVILLGLAWLTATMLRRRSASVRASVWTAALAAVLLLPIASVVTPPLTVRILPAPEPPPAANITASTSEAPPVPVNVVGTAPTHAANVVETAPATPPTDATRVSGNAIAAGFLGLVTVLLLIRTAAGHRRMRLIARRAVDADGAWIALADDVRRDLGLRRPIPVRVTDETNVPAVAGLFRPVLLLPIETGDWPLDARRAVVLHELAHVARRDAMGQLIGQIACAFYWFVPLAWYGARRAAAFRERASDDVVIQAGVRPSSYAENLIALARSSSHSLHSEATMAMAESRIHERIAAILMPGARRERLTWPAAISMPIVMFATTAVVGAIEPAQRDTGAAAIRPANFVPPPIELMSPIAPAAEPRRHQTARPAAAPVAQPAQADRFCGGKGLDRSSSSIHENDNERRWTVKLSGDGCSVDLRAEGKLEFNADFTDIARIDPNGFFRVDVTDRGVRRQLDIEPKGGSLVRTWRVDGSERPYDADARAWFAGFLIELDRRTAIGVDIRLPLLVRQGGVDAVLKETALMASDYARSQYYMKLPKATKLTPADTARLLKQAGSVSSSAYYLSELVSVYGVNVQDATVRTALIDLVERMDSDYYQASSIETILGNSAPGPAEMDVLVRLLPKMDSDFYKSQVMLKVLKAPSLGASHRAAIATASVSIASDYNAAEVLQAIAQKGLADDAVRRAFFEAAAKIESDHYHGTVLTAVLSAPSLTERDLLEVVASSKGIGSDYNRSEVLTRVARHAAATDRVRTAVLDASAGMSKHYADEVRRAAGK